MVNEIAVLKVRLAELEALRANLQHTLDSTQGRLGSICIQLNPTNRLPNEILSHIMEDTCLDFPSQPGS